MDERIATLISGYARANIFLEKERVDRLVHMTAREARAIFDDLTEAWENTQNKGDGLEHLDARRIDTLIAVRLAFTRMAQALGLLYE